MWGDDEADEENEGDGMRFVTAIPPFSVGSIIAFLVIVFGILMMAEKIDVTPITVGGMLVGLAIARLT